MCINYDTVLHDTGNIASLAYLSVFFMCVTCIRRIKGTARTLVPVLWKRLVWPVLNAIANIELMSMLTCHSSAVFFKSLQQASSCKVTMKHMHPIILYVIYRTVVVVSRPIQHSAAPRAV